MKKTIQQFLEGRCAQDPLFAERVNNPKKSLDECIKYLIGEFYKRAINDGDKSGGAFIDDTEFFSLVVHYYDEDDIKIEEVGDFDYQAFGVKYELTPEDYEKAKKDALERIEQEYYNKLHEQKKKAVETPKQENQQTLFDL